VVDASLEVGGLLTAVRAELPATVTEFELFDVYQGQGIESGKKSLAFRMLLQHTEKTLTDAEIDAAVAAVLALLSRRFGAVLRA
jgi:phenylalanyl-tRNA synthetase beta chain